MANNIFDAALAMASTPLSGMFSTAPGNSMRPAATSPGRIDYDLLLGLESRRRGWDEDQLSEFEAWRHNVGQIESDNIPDRTQGGGPKGIGRGKYQYEQRRGGKGSGHAITASTRLKAFLDRYNFKLDDLPANDVLEIRKTDPDFSLLSEDTQDIIFLADKAIAPEAILDDLVNRKVRHDDAWIDWHWKGDPAHRDSKKAQWRRNKVDTKGTEKTYEELFNHDPDKLPEL